MKGMVVGNFLCEGPIRAKHACVLHARILRFNLVAFSPNDYQASTCIILAPSYLERGLHADTRIPFYGGLPGAWAAAGHNAKQKSACSLQNGGWYRTCGTVQCITGASSKWVWSQSATPCKQDYLGDITVTCISSSGKEKQCWNISTCFSVWSFPCGLFCQLSTTAWELGNSRGNFFF